MIFKVNIVFSKLYMQAVPKIGQAWERPPAGFGIACMAGGLKYRLLGLAV
jgi:hypothetical protein